MRKVNFKPLFFAFLIASFLFVFANSLRAGGPELVEYQTTDSAVACSVYLPMVSNQVVNPYPPLSPPVEVEPNNSSSTANGFLQPNVTYTAMPNDLHDAFKLHVSSGGRLTISVDGHTGSGVTLVIYNSSTQRLGFENLPESGSGTFSFNLDRGGVYLIDIVTLSNYNSDQAYRLSYQFAGNRQSQSRVQAPAAALNCDPTDTLIHERFDGNELNTAVWGINQCPSDENINFANGALRFKLDANSSGDWEACNILPISQRPAVSNIELKVKIEDGDTSIDYSSGFIGIFSSCGDEWTNLALSPIGVIASSVKVNPNLTTVESFDGLKFPIERTIQMSWTGTKVKFASLDGSNLMGDFEISCTSYPDYFVFGVGTNPGGYISGEIDDILVTKLNDEPAPTPTPAPDFGAVVEFTGWNHFGDSEVFDISQGETTVGINYKTPSDGVSRYIGFSADNGVESFSAAEIRTRLVKSGTVWDVIYFGSGWDTDGNTESFDEDYYVTFGYSKSQIFVAIYTTGSPSPRVFWFPASESLLDEFKVMKVENIGGTLYFYFDGQLMMTWDFPLEGNENAYGEVLQLEAYIVDDPENDVAGQWKSLKLRPYSP